MPLALYLDHNVPRAIASAAWRQQNGIPFTGIIYVQPLRLSIGARIRDLEMITKAGTPEDLYNRVEILPL